MGKSHNLTGVQRTRMTDKHVGLAVIFDVPAGEDYKSYFPKFYSLVKSGTAGCLYYGFATCGSKVLCREGYKDAVAMLTHSKEVHDELETMVKKLGKERVRILCSGPQDQLDIIKAKMDDRLTVKFVTLDAGAVAIAAMPSGCQDSHTTILPEFTVPAGKMAEFQGGFPKFYKATKDARERRGVCIMYLLLLETPSTAGRGTRMLRQQLCTALTSRTCWINQCLVLLASRST